MFSADLYESIYISGRINKYKLTFSSRIVSKRQGGDEKTLLSFLRMISHKCLKQQFIMSTLERHRSTVCVCLCETYFMYCRSELPLCLRIIIASATS